MTAMQKLTTELNRLYQGDDAAQGETRAITLAFRRLQEDGEAGHWERLCEVANAMQSDLHLPAPAVSVSGDGAFGLWLSLARPVAEVQAQEFRDLVYQAYCPALVRAGSAAGATPALPPQLDQGSGKWSAFIHAGMGASFAGDEALEMQPPESGQVALLEGLESIAPAQFAQALDQLRQRCPGTGPAPTPTPAGAPSAGLLLKDATLEDIVRHLHAMNIEPTFRFLPPR
jgi:hypothetical protein